MMIEFTWLGSEGGTDFAEITLTQRTWMGAKTVKHRIAKINLYWFFVETGELTPSDWNIDALERKYDAQKKIKDRNVKTGQVWKDSKGSKYRNESCSRKRPSLATLHGLGILR